MARAESLQLGSIFKSAVSWQVVFGAIMCLAFYITIAQPEARLSEDRDRSQKDATLDSPEILRQAETLEPSILLAEGKMDLAVTKAHALAKSKPRDVAAMISAGNVLTKISDKDEGFRYLRRAVALAPNSRYVRLNLALRLMEDKQYGPAELQLRLIIEAYPDWSKPRIDLAQIYLKTGRTKDAVDELGLALQSDSNNFEARRQRALALAKIDNYREGLAEYVLADSIEQQVMGLPKDIRKLKDTWGSLDRAVFQLLRERQDRPEDPAVKIRLARIYLYMGQLRESKQLLNEARKSAPSNPEIHRNLAIVLQKLGDTTQALNSFTNASKYSVSHEEQLPEIESQPAPHQERQSQPVASPSGSGG